jgi:hypothetical protein
MVMVHQVEFLPLLKPGLDLRTIMHYMTTKGRNVFSERAASMSF